MQHPCIFMPPSVQFTAKKMVMSTWVDHMPFAYDLVATLQPSKIVELGTHNGLSFFTFCQALQENNVDGLAYAVDTWQGDEHTGAYGEEVFEMVRDHCREHYRGNSYLLRMTFDEAADHFADQSIDLLHIDGLHTYDAVSHDFQTWLPKVRPGGVVLFHDIEARMEDFGVWRFWQDIKPQYQSYEFRFGFGLGVVIVPGASRPAGTLFDLMFDGDEMGRHELQKFYVTVGHYHELQRKLSRARR